MTYSMIEAKADFAHRIDACVETRDVEEAYAIANLFAEQDDMESASHFRKMARGWETEDNYHDEVIGN